MPNTYSQIYIQSIFAVKHRKASIQNSWKPRLQSVIGQLLIENGCKTIIVNGVEDHIHCFFELKSSKSLSSVMQSVKAKSSKWVNESGVLENRFEWQSGFGSFSYSRSHIDAVFKYIKNQEVYHKEVSFKEEYIKMLERFGIDYDKRFIFQDLK